jgi:hypothetical protein
MKAILTSLFVLLFFTSKAQDYNSVSASYGYDSKYFSYTTVAFNMMSDDWDAYTGFYGSATFFEDNTVLMIGWRLESYGDDVRFYAGSAVGISMFEGNWGAFEIYGGVRPNWQVAPFAELCYGNFTMAKVGIEVRLSK